MKKLYTTLMMAMMAMMTLSFTSCETDEEIARDLEGTWIGNMHIVDDYGEATTYSELTFTRYTGLASDCYKTIGEVDDAVAYQGIVLYM